VETEPEVQGVWAVPSMARLGLQIPDHLALFIMLEFYCSICIYNGNATVVAMPHSVYVLTAASS